HPDERRQLHIARGISGARSRRRQPRAVPRRRSAEPRGGGPSPDRRRLSGRLEPHRAAGAVRFPENRSALHHWTLHPTSAVDLRHAISDNLDNCHFVAKRTHDRTPLGNPWCGVETAGVGRKRWFLDLLGRARSLFKGLGTPPVAKVQYYSVVCPLGHRLRGQRTGGYQALRCPSCGEGIFVLPASPLPEPVAPERPARARTASAARADVDEGPIELKDPAQVTVDIVEPDDLAVEAEIIWDDEVPASPAPAAPTAKPSPGATPTTGRPEAARRRQPTTLDPGPGARVPVAATRAGTSELAQPRTARGSGRRPLV